MISISLLAALWVPSSTAHAQTPPVPHYYSFKQECGAKYFRQTFLGFVAESFTVSNQPAVTCKDALVIDQLTGAIFKSVRGFPIGKPDLFLVRQASNGSADIDLHVGMNISADASQINPYTQGMIAHEVGHFLFRWGISAVNPRVKKIFDMDYIDNQFNYQQDYVDLLTAEHASPAMIQQETAIANQLGNLSDGADEAIGAYSDKIDQALTAMSELFADTVAVLYYRDPAINAKTVLPILKDPNLIRVFGRDFSDARNTVENVKLLSNGDVHTLLSPVRLALYQAYFKNGNYDPAIANRLLAAVAQVIALYEKGAAQGDLNALLLQQLKL